MPPRMLTVDVARMAEGFSRPGIDPRTWSTIALVTAVEVTAAGTYVRITTIGGIVETAAVVTQYGGPGYGLYCPVAVNDWVLIEVPEGDWNAGARVVAQVVDAGNPPPAEAMAHPEDVALVVKPGQSIRIVVSGGGDAIVEARDGGSVKLGGEDATRGVARASDTVALSTAQALALQTALDARYTVLNPLATIPAGTVTGAIATASDIVKAT